MLVSILGVWTARNYRLLGQPIVGTTHGGYTLYLGNNWLYYASLRGELQQAANWPEYNARFLQPEIDAVWRRSGVVRNQMAYGRSVWIAPLGATPYPEVAADNALYDAALDTIANDPGGFLRACLYRLRRFWGLVPIEPSDKPGMRYAIGAWYFALFAYALAGLWQLGRSRRLWQSPWLFGLLLTLTFMAVHTVYWTDMRMRAPITSVVCLAAAVGTQWLWGLYRGVASPPETTT